MYVTIHVESHTFLGIIQYSIHMVEEGSMQQRFFGMNNKVSSMEKKLGTFESQLRIIEEDSIDKHREAMEQIKEFKNSIAGIQEQISDFQEQIERLSDRLGEFASRENVKVLEKYINLWSPLDFVTRKEAQEIVHNSIPKSRRIK